jgi:hypothetical protein
MKHKPIPCKDCITLAICKSQVADSVHPFVKHEIIDKFGLKQIVSLNVMARIENILMPKCSILNEYVKATKTDIFKVWNFYKNEE